MIQLQHLHKFFNKGRQNEIHVINDVCLNLPSKGMVAIFGKSGCGKTTLLNVIGGLDKFADGILTIDGQDICQNTDTIRNRYIGYIFQNYNLNKELSCFDNVANALKLCGLQDPDVINKRVMAALANVGMEKYWGRTPDTLSGGQQQRVAIARAIVKNPGIILADEPTGNLDDANTVLIMDLLKAISKDHLVLLVTHEANLVDYYCDTVIELSDGKVVNVKSNTSANGYAVRDKSDIYLGELNRHTLSDDHAEVTFYGDTPEVPVKLKIVHNGGKLYVQIDTEKVQIVDSSSEIKFKDGIYREIPQENSVSKSIDMSKLPPVTGTRFGHLFTFASSAKSGYVANFKKRKKGKKLLRGCMATFAAVVVFMSAGFGTALRDIGNVQNAYSHNTFYLYTPDGQVSAKLNAAVSDGSTGIDFIKLSGGYLSRSTISFRTGSFETFPQYGFYRSPETNAIYLDLSMAEKLPLVAGRKDNLAQEEVLISTAVADALLKQSSLGYITQRKDLIGLVSTTFSVNGMNPRIAGIVESNEPAVYANALALARYVRNAVVLESFAQPASDFNMSVAPGETMLLIKSDRPDAVYPEIGETIQIQGVDLKVTAIKRAYDIYEIWLEKNGIQKLDLQGYFTQVIQKEQPSLPEGTEAFQNALEQAIQMRYYEYYEDYASEFDAFSRDLYLFTPNAQDLWLYFEKNIEDAKYRYLPKQYSKIHMFKKLYGHYPTKDELDAVYSKLPDFDLTPYINAYQDEYWKNDHNLSFFYNTYLLSDTDYITTSKQLGPCHPSALPATYSGLMDNNTNGLTKDAYIAPYYTEIHASDKEKAQAWLKITFPDIAAPNDWLLPLATPEDVFQSIIHESAGTIGTNLLTMAQFLILMCLCMYFIMRSALMSRVKEVGIYRAIGVCRKNLLFRFLIESLVLTGLTVFIGYLLSSGFIYISMRSSSLVAEIFYYPPWLAGIVLAVLAATSLFCGTLPVLLLLRKTPSEILAKYDI